MNKHPSKKAIYLHPDNFPHEFLVKILMRPLLLTALLIASSVALDVFSVGKGDNGELGTGSSQATIIPGEVYTNAKAMCAGMFHLPGL